jgi:replicative DNA helicase
MVVEKDEIIADIDRVIEKIGGYTALRDKRDIDRVPGAIKSITDRSIDAYLQAIKSSPEGRGTGLRGLDDLGAKILPGSLTTILARPGNFKTTFLLHLWRHFLRQDGPPPLFATYEVVWVDLVTRFLMSEAKAGLSFEGTKGYFKGGERDNALIESAVERVSKMMGSGRFLLLDEPTLCVGELCKVIERLNTECGDVDMFTGHDIQGLSVVLLDYLQLVPPTQRGATRQEQIQSVLTALRQTAIKTGLSIVLAAQAGRDAAGKQPELHHCRESGDTENDSTLVISLHEKSNGKHSALGDAIGERVPIRAKILKNRYGQKGGTCEFYFDPSTATLEA